MIVGIGIDLVELDRIAKIHARYGLKFLQKFLRESEIEALPESPVPRLAGRFALKEAAVKALGVGFAAGVTPRDIIIHNDASGKPVAIFEGAALVRANLLGVSAVFASVSHERGVAAGLVILESNPNVYK